jgi:ribosomal protein L7/L12
MHSTLTKTKTMTVTEKLDSWNALFEARDIDVDEAEGPEETDAGWFQTLTRFTKRGFLRVVVSPTDDSLRFHVQFAVPTAEVAYAEGLKYRLKGASDQSWDLTAQERPWVLEAKAVPEENVGETLDVLTLVAEHIERAERGAQPEELVGEFAQETQDVGDSQAESPKADDSDDQAEASGGVFEPIGADADADAEAEAQAEPPEPSDEEADAPSSQLVLEEFRVKVSDRKIIARLDMRGRPNRGDKQRLRSALERSLRARFDVKLLLYKPDDKGDIFTLKLGMAPAGLGVSDQDSLSTLRRGLERYFERLVKFNELGMSLLDVLGPGGGTRSDERPKSRDDDQRAERSSRAMGSDEASGHEERGGQGESDRRSEPHLRRREDHRRAETDSSGVVFSFGAAEASGSETSTLAAGDFTDPRVMRDDATTPLVDVVLRHPGYSDKSMRQVLSILLDVDYYKAGKLIDDAPCTIAWGISQERAQQFKQVIENAGGRVTLVEPDSLTS